MLSGSSPMIRSSDVTAAFMVTFSTLERISAPSLNELLPRKEERTRLLLISHRSKEQRSATMFSKVQSTNEALVNVPPIISSPSSGGTSGMPSSCGPVGPENMVNGVR